MTIHQEVLMFLRNEPKVFCLSLFLDHIFIRELTAFIFTVWVNVNQQKRAECRRTSGSESASVKVFLFCWKNKSSTWIALKINKQANHHWRHPSPLSMTPIIPVHSFHPTWPTGVCVRSRISSHKTQRRRGSMALSVLLVLFSTLGKSGVCSVVF